MNLSLPIPPELALRVASFLDLPSLMRVSRCSKHLHELCKDKSLWKGLYDQLKLPEMNGAYQVQLKQFCGRFVVCFSTLNPSWKNSSIRAKTLACYQEFMKKTRTATYEEKKQSLNQALKTQFSDIALHFYRQYSFAFRSNEPLVMAFKANAKDFALALLKDPKEVVLCDYKEETETYALHLRAVRYQQPESLRLLLAKLPIGEKFRGLLVISCLDAKYIEEMTLALLQPILECGISQKSRIEAVRKAVDLNNSSAIELLLKNGRVPNCHCSKFLHDAAVKTDLACLKALQMNGPLDEFYLDKTLKGVVSARHPSVFLNLLRCGSISDTFRGKAIIHYSSLNNIEVVARLLENGPISEEDCYMALTVAEENEEPVPDLVNLLESHHQKMISHQDEAIKAAEPVLKKTKNT